MLPDRVSNPGPLTYESGALPMRYATRPRGRRGLSLCWSSFVSTFCDLMFVYLSWCQRRAVIVAFPKDILEPDSTIKT